MKIYIIMACALFLFAGDAAVSEAQESCITLPDLVPTHVRKCRSNEDCLVMVKIRNKGDATAGRHLTYVEINAPSVAEREKPQSQCSLDVLQINKKTTTPWLPVKRECLSVRYGTNFDPSRLSIAEVVVRADAKKMVNECNEQNNDRRWHSILLN